MDDLWELDTEEAQREARETAEVESWNSDTRNVEGVDGDWIDY